MIPAIPHDLFWGARNLADPVDGLGRLTVALSKLQGVVWLVARSVVIVSRPAYPFAADRGLSFWMCFPVEATMLSGPRRGRAPSGHPVLCIPGAQAGW